MKDAPLTNAAPLPSNRVEDCGCRDRRRRWPLPLASADEPDPAPAVAPTEGA